MCDITEIDNSVRIRSFYYQQQSIANIINRITSQQVLERIERIIRNSFNTCKKKKERIEPTS